MLLLIFASVFAVGTGSRTASDGRTWQTTYDYYFYWPLLGALAFILVVSFPASMYVGRIVESRETVWDTIVGRIVVFVPAFVGLAFIAFFDICLAFSFGSLFYFILAALMSLPMIVLLILRLKSRRPALFKLTCTAILASAAVAIVEIRVARPLVLLLCLIPALALSLPLFALIGAPIGKATPILYATVLAAILVIDTVPWTSRHRFLHDLGRIRPGRYVDPNDPGMIVLATRHGRGMSFADVDEIMEGYPLMVDGRWYRPIKQHYKPQIPFPADYVADVNARRELSIVDGRASYRHSGAGHFNADFGWVHFRNGYVVSVRFLPD